MATRQRPLGYFKKDGKTRPITAKTGRRRTRTTKPKKVVLPRPASSASGIHWKKKGFEWADGDSITESEIHVVKSTPEVDVHWVLEKIVPNNRHKPNDCFIVKKGAFGNEFVGMNSALAAMTGYTPLSHYYILKDYYIFKGTGDRLGGYQSGMTHKDFPSTPKNEALIQEQIGLWKRQGYRQYEK